MSLSNELSSEIAEALLSSTNRTPHELKDLQEVVFRIHTVLRQMDKEGQPEARRQTGSLTEKGAAAGNS
jgi:hypothetical protein